LKKGVVFVWSQDQEVAFAALKTALSSAPVLALPNFARPFIIETDASDVSVLVVDGYPLAFLSKALGIKSKGLSIYEKEYMTILLVVQQWHPYLQESEFFIHTNHKSLTQLNEQWLHTTWQHKVFTKLLGLQYKIIYKKGVENRVADALSRRVPDQAELSAISLVIPDWLLSVQLWPEAAELIGKLSLDSSTVPNFIWDKGLLRYKSKIWIGNDAHLHSQLIAALHNSVVGGHSGIPVTYRRLKQIFYWRGMKVEVQEFVKSC
jgi:hypothetical protein